MMSVAIVIWSDICLFPEPALAVQLDDYCPDAGINQKFLSAEYPRDAKSVAPVMGIKPLLVSRCAS